MNKFEIGQRVRVVAAGDGSQDTDLLGETGVIEDIFHTVSGYSVQMDPEFEMSAGFGGLYFEDHELEAVSDFT